MKKYMNPKTIITTIVTSWILWVSHTLVELDKSVGKLSVSVCTLAKLAGAECPAEIAQREPAPDGSFGIEPELASPIFSFPESRKETRQ